MLDFSVTSLVTGLNLVTLHLDICWQHIERIPQIPESAGVWGQKHRVTLHGPTYQLFFFELSAQVLDCGETHVV